MARSPQSNPPANEHAKPPALHGVERTLFLPLIVRAQAPVWSPLLDPQDGQAQQVLAQSGQTLGEYPVDMATALNILWRTRKIKDLASQFFAHFPHVQGVNLGAGLSDYFQWLDNGENRWLDIDLPEVVDLRKQLLPQTAERTEVRADDLRRAGWWDRLGLQRHNHRNPLLLISEGVLMYMQPTEVKAFFQEIGEHAPEGTELLCDFISPLGIGQTTLANQQPGERVAFGWGAHNGMEIASFHPRLELLEQHSVAEAYGWAGQWLEMLCTPVTGGPLYGLAHLKVSDD